MCHDRSATVDRAYDFRIFRHILNKDGRQVWAAPILLRTVDKGRATTSRAPTSSRSVHGADRGLKSWASVAQFRQCFSQVFGVHLLVRSILQADLPAMGRAGWW